MKFYKSLFFSSLFIVFLSGCKQQELLTGLDQTQANEVIALLQVNNIPAIKLDRSKEGFSIKVNSADFSSAVSLMKAYDQPSPAKVELAQMFPADSLISSPRAEKVRILSGIEQRLGQSILYLSGVVAARVHVSYDVDAGEGGRKEEPTHLSALVKHERDIDSDLLISDVQRVLKNSFANVDYKNISVVLTQVPQLNQQNPIAKSSNNSSYIFIILLGLLSIISCGILAWLALKNKKVSLKSIVND